MIYTSSDGLSLIQKSSAIYGGLSKVCWSHELHNQVQLEYNIVMIQILGLILALVKHYYILILLVG